MKKIERVWDGGARFANTVCDSLSIREASLKEGPALEPLVLGGVISLFTGDVQRLVEVLLMLPQPWRG